MENGFVLSDYLARIGLEEAPPLTSAGLRSLHVAQVRSIPFENISPFLGEAVNIGPADLQAKLVHGSRGGYCFELNGLFFLALQSCGFPVRPLLGRVFNGSPEPGPRTHQISLVEAEGAEWIADVGFGGPGLTEPIQLVEQELEQGYRRIRLRHDAMWGWVFEQEVGGAWDPIYAFTLDHTRDIDRELGNFFTSTHPDSIFRKQLMCARFTETGKVTILNRVASRYTGLKKEENRMDDAATIRLVLKAWFGIGVSTAQAEKIHERLAELERTGALPPPRLKASDRLLSRPF